MAHQTFVVAVANRKGGAGKSTLCIGLAGAAERAGLSVAILDTDKNASTYLWRMSRDEIMGVDSDPFVERVDKVEQELESRLDFLRENKVDLVLIDTPGYLDVLINAVTLADLAIVPVRGTKLDLQSLPGVFTYLNKLKVPGMVVLNAIHPSSRKSAMDTRTEIAAAGYPVLGTWITQLNLYATAAGDGHYPQEMPDAEKPTADLKAVMDFIQREIKRKKGQGAEVTIKQSA